MPDPVPKKRRAGTDEQRFVRVRDGTIYGPVPLSELLEWAESGNIMPGDEISTDRERWGFATVNPDLRMNVMIDRGDGAFLGPFNEKAIEPLIKSGLISANAKRLHIEDLAPPSVTLSVPKFDRHKVSAIESELRADLQAEIDERIETAAQQARDAIAERDREIETLQTALSEAKNAAADSTQCEELETKVADLGKTLAKKEKAIVEKDKIIAEKDAALTDEKTRSNNFESELSMLRIAHAELLDFANSRDAEYIAKIAALESAPTAQPLSPASSDYDAVATRLKRKEAALLDAEREFSAALLKWQTANTALQERVKELETGAGSLF